MLNNQRITQGLMHWPRHGSWWVRVETDSEEQLSGDVTISLADLALVGEIERGGISGSVGSYLVRGGLGWDREIAPRPYQSDAGVRLRTVLLDLARDALGRPKADRIVLPPDRVLGTAYCRPGSDAAAGVRVTARDVLARIAPYWYVDANGITVLSRVPRTLGPIGVAAQIRRRGMASGLRSLSTEEPGAFIPGSTFDGITVGATVIHVQSDDFSLEVWPS